MRIENVLIISILGITLGVLGSCAGSPAPTAGSPQDVVVQESPKASLSMAEKLDAYSALRDKVQSAQKSNQGSDMLDLANQGLELFPDSADMLWVKFDAYRRMGFSDKAQAVLETLLGMENNLIADNYHTVGDFYSFELRDPTTGVEYYSKAINTNPFTAGWTYRQRAEAFASLGQTDRALGDLDKAAFIAQSMGDKNMLQNTEEARARLTGNGEAKK